MRYHSSKKVHTTLFIFIGIVILFERIFIIPHTGRMKKEDLDKQSASFQSGITPTMVDRYMAAYRICNALATI